MKKHLKKNYLGILKKLIITLIIILLLILLFGFIDDLLNKLDILIKFTDQQASQIHTLEQEISSLELANAKLENVITYQHNQIQELRVNGNTITVDLRPKVVNVPSDLHKEIQLQEVHNGNGFTTTIVATILSALTMAKAVGIFSPVMP